LGREKFRLLIVVKREIQVVERKLQIVDLCEEGNSDC
jgi:hypothetical protein